MTTPPTRRDDIELRTAALRTVTACLVAATGIASCGGNVMTRDTSVGDVTDQSTVAVEGDPAGKHVCDGSMFVDWPEGTAEAIRKGEGDGVVIVRSAGCKLEVLGGCHAKGGYDFVAVTPTRDRTEVSAENAARFGVDLGKGRHVGAEAGMGSGHSIEYAIVGQQMAKEAPGKLDGSCDGATHYVSAISVGAYGTSSQSHSEVTAVVKLHDQKSESHETAGDVERCSKHGASGDDACKTPLRVELHRLTAAQ